MNPEREEYHKNPVEHEDLSPEEATLWTELYESIPDERGNILHVYSLLADGDGLPVSIRRRLASMLTRPAEASYDDGAPMWNIETFCQLLLEIDAYDIPIEKNPQELMATNSRFVEDLSYLVIEWFEKLNIRNKVKDSVGRDGSSEYTRGWEYYSYNGLANLLAEYIQVPETFERLYDVSPYSKNDPYWQIDFRGKHEIIIRLVYGDERYFSATHLQIQNQVAKELADGFGSSDMLREIQHFIYAYELTSGGHWDGHQNADEIRHFEALRSILET